MNKTPFLKACSRGDLELLKLLVARGCDVHAVATDVPEPVDGAWMAGVFGAPQEVREYIRSLSTLGGRR